MLIAADLFNINQSDNNAVDINEEESIDQAQIRHNMNGKSDVINTLAINEQATRMHFNTVAEEAMKLHET